MGLCDNKSLRYQYLYNFDVVMNNLDEVFGFLSNKYQYVTLKHEGDKLIDPKNPIISDAIKIKNLYL